MEEELEEEDEGNRGEEVWREETLAAKLKENAK